MKKDEEPGLFSVLGILLLAVFSGLLLANIMNRIERIEGRLGLPDCKTLTCTGDK